MYQEDFDNAFSQEKSGDDIYSRPVRAGKRTYFFDVKATKNNDYYLTSARLRKMAASAMTSTRFSSTRKTLKSLPKVWKKLCSSSRKNALYRREFTQNLLKPLSSTIALTKEQMISPM